MALDPTTIAISPQLIPDLSLRAFKEHASGAVLDDLRLGSVQYRKVKALKLALLDEAFQSFLKKHDAKNSARANEFRQFLEGNQSWIADYALFRVLMERHDQLPIWEQWAEEHHSPSQARSWVLSLPPDERAAVEQRKLFFCYVQWIARQQWTDLKSYAESHNVSLMGDIPYGIGRYSADVWANPHLFDLRWSCGAPPETFFKPDLFTEKWGQNWGIPLYRWDRMKEDHYAWWRQRIRGICEIFQWFRIDHVLGFYRIYAFPWKPEENSVYVHLSQQEVQQRLGHLPRFWPGPDETPSQKAHNQSHGEELLRMVIEASGESGLIAEDLGVVPDYVRPSLTALGIPGFKIPLFERDHQGRYHDSEKYQPLSLATLATHDHEPMASLWQHWHSSENGRREIEHLMHWIGWQHPPHEFTHELHAAICRKLLSSSSWLAIFMITDLFGEIRRFNMPGPMSESNWTERLPIPVSSFDEHPQYRDALARLAPYLGRN